MCIRDSGRRAALAALLHTSDRLVAVGALSIGLQRCVWLARWIASRVRAASCARTNGVAMLSTVWHWTALRQVRELRVRLGAVNVRSSAMR
eukprot:3908205-Alexandrium_andersonii.AAC.1